jgi:hypothetical protein
MNIKNKKLLSILLLLITFSMIAGFTMKRVVADDCDPEVDLDCPPCGPYPLEECPICDEDEGTQLPSCLDCELFPNQPGCIDNCSGDAYPGIQPEKSSCPCIWDPSPEMCVTYQCHDPDATNSATQADLDNCLAINAKGGGMSCVGERGVPHCTYPAVGYCPPTTQSSCEDANPNRTCFQKPDSECIGDNDDLTCDWSRFDIVTCPTGKKYPVSVQGSYTKTLPTDSCTAPSITPEEAAAEIIQYCTPQIPPIDNCTTPDCDETDWCPDEPGIQSDPDLCAVECPEPEYISDNAGSCKCANPEIVGACGCPDGFVPAGNVCRCIGSSCYHITDYCPDPIYDPGIQTSYTQCLDKCPNFDGLQRIVPTGYKIDLATRDCVCAAGTCPNIDGECGSINGQIITAKTDITRDAACNFTAGELEATSTDSVNYNWKCFGLGETALSPTCNASIGCAAGTYSCDGLCIPDTDICNVLGGVSINKLKVTPVVTNGACTVSWDKEGVTGNSSITTCILSTQDGVVPGRDNFDPSIVHNYTAGDLDHPIKKDTIFTLRCQDTPTDPEIPLPDPVEAIGSCRLNLGYKETH